MNTNNSINLNLLSLTDKKLLLSQVRAAIKNDMVMNKAIKLEKKAEKEAAKKDKIQNAIKAAQDKLAKLQAKLA